MNSQNDDEQTGREEQRWEHLTAVSLSANSRKKEKSAQYLSESRTLRLMSRFLPVTYSSLSRPHIHNTYVSESQDGNTNVKGVDNANRAPMRGNNHLVSLLPYCRSRSSHLEQRRCVSLESKTEIVLH